MLRTQLVPVMLFFLVAAGTLAAQSQEVMISGNVPDHRGHYYLIELTQDGDEAEVALSLETTSSVGLYVELYDLDGAAEGEFWADDSDFVIGAGVVSFSLSIPSRTGVFQMLLSVGTEDTGGSADYDGSVSVDAGALA